MTLTPELRAIKERVEAFARDYGLDFFETHYEMIDHESMNEIAAYGGFPTRYPHWRHGMSYEHYSKGYQYGLQKISELVINNDPCYAYLMRSNSTLDQKMVMAHVYGHSDFFKCNLWFKNSNRKMVDQMANHGVRIRRHVEQVGVDEVERFIDLCLSLENLVDLNNLYVASDHKTREAEDSGRGDVSVRKLRSKGYMDRYINPPELIEAERERLREAKATPQRVPAQPTRDVLGFLLEHAPLKGWQRDVLGMIRAEALYFAPQAMTKIMNEGWASYWHSKLMTECLLEDHELIDYAEMHAAVLGTQPGQLNPYKLGLELWRDIEDRWNRGRHGSAFDACDDMAAKHDWDTGAMAGRDKIFEIRTVMHDVSFIDAFLTEDFCREQQLFVFQPNSRSGQNEIGSRDFDEVKQQLLFSMTNMGNPIIEVVEANHRNRGELYLLHRWEGHDLQFDEAAETLKNVCAIWGRPVHIETRDEGRGRLITFDGERVESEDITPTFA